MPHWVGRFPQGIWNYHVGAHSDASWAAFLAEFERELIRAKPPVALITLTHDINPPTASQRKALADLARTELSKKITLHCFVARSRMVQLTLTALDWLLKKPYKEKVFVTAAEGLRWVKGQSPDFDAESLTAEIRATVPTQLLMEDLRQQPRQQRATF